MSLHREGLTVHPSAFILHPRSRYKAVSGVIVPKVCAPPPLLPATVLFPRDSKVLLELAKPTPVLFVTVDVDTRTVPPLLAAMPSALLFEATLLSIFNTPPASDASP